MSMDGAIPCGVRYAPFHVHIGKLNSPQWFERDLEGATNELLHGRDLRRGQR